MSNLLINEPPLQVLPSLAIKVGLGEAIILQQLHYWLLRSSHIKDGKKWAYNSYPEWQKQFPFWHQDTIKRMIARLEKTGHILSGNYNKMKMDKTKWYTINYEKIGMPQPSMQNAPTIRAICTDEEGEIHRPIPETTTETTTEKKHIYAEQVSLTVDEHEKLIAELGKEYAGKMIERLSLYKLSTGKKYKSDYHTIKVWDRKDKEKHSTKKTEDKLRALEGM